MASAGLEHTRCRAMVDMLRQQDQEIDHIVAYSKFVVAYLLHQDGPNPGWRKANIEGPVYLVRRRSHPRYQLLVKNQFSNNDSLDSLHPDWELDCQKNYVFYKVEDPTKQIRGLWFHDDAERQKLEGLLESTLEELRGKAAEPHGEPPPHTAEPVREQVSYQGAAPGMPMGHDANVNMDSLYMQYGLTKPADGGPNVRGHVNQGMAPVERVNQGMVQPERVMVTREQLREALHEVVNDDTFMGLLMSRLKGPATMQ